MDEARVETAQPGGVAGHVEDSAALDSRLAGYLVTNRDFMAPAVEAAVASLGLPADARVVDAGTGAGGALPPLARAASVVEGIDLNAALVPIAVEYARRSALRRWRRSS